MKYCISLYRNHPLQNTVDEMIVKYNAKDKTMFEFIEQHITRGVQSIRTLFLKIVKFCLVFML